MKYKLFAFVLCFSSWFLLTAQKTNQTKKERIEIAETLIKNLHDGYLLVRLSNRQKTIDVLIKSGQESRAKQYSEKLARENQALVTAFKNYYSFCPVYFFYSNQSKYVLNKEFGKVDFLDDSLKTDPSIKPEKSQYLIAEITNIEQDTTSRYEDTYIVPGESGPETRSTYSGGTDFGFQAMIVKTENFVQIRKPFPFYVRTFDSLPIKRKPSTIVKKLNSQLNAYYWEVNQN
ncbi:MAG: hypothetical protein ACPGEG_08780 [Salibacteraceae bacterium]